MGATTDAQDGKVLRPTDGKVAVGAIDDDLPRSPTDPKLYRADVVMDRPYGELIEGAWFASRQRTITETDVVNFASLTGDWHPAHTNELWAADNVFGERIAHGMLLLSYAIGLVPNAYIVALRRIKNVIYKEPVRFGDTVHVRGRCERLQPLNDDVGMVTAKWKLVNQNIDTCVKMEFECLWRGTWIT
jgi:3-hydroxybutyryl-CoA dehydratase